ncbi:MAG: helix-turn-helix domain-containing protein [Burkholderiaceae bacterium]|nr:helix-turn-helix domain-containing protein [Burkholderiaceae bacterium]
MPTLDITEAARLLKVHPKTLQGLARAGCIPACKIGRAWVFVESMLLDHLTKLSAVRVALSGEENFQCPSTGAKIRPSGGSSYRPSLANRDLYSKALGLPTSARRSRSMIASQPPDGSKTDSA